MRSFLHDGLPRRPRRGRMRLAPVALVLALTPALAVPASASLIQGVTLTAEPYGAQPPRVAPASICTGEVLEVSVTAQHPTDPAQRVSVTVDAYPGERRFLQFFGEPGTRHITVGAASSDGLVDHQALEVKVDACEVSDLPRISSRVNPYRPDTVDFRIEAFGSLAFDDPDFYVDFGDGSGGTAQDGYVSHFYGASVDGQSPYHSFIVTVSDQPIAGGQVAPGALVRRYAVTLVDSYYFGKLKGFLQPPSITSRVFEARGSDLVGSYRIRNLEPEPLLLEHATLEHLACDLETPASRAIVTPAEVVFQGGYGLELGDPRLWDDPEFQSAMDLKASLEWIPEDAWVAPPQLAPGDPELLSLAAVGSISDLAGRTSGTTVTFPPLPPPPGGSSGAVVLPALYTHEGYLTLEASTIPESVCAVAFHLIGRTEGGVRAYVSLYYETRENPSSVTEVSDPALAGFLMELLQRGLVNDPSEITQEDIYSLEQRGLVRRTETGWEVQ